jgi:hypothetical protein
MRFIEYVLAAILGSSGIAAAEPTSPATRTLTADAITQPSGGTEGLLGQIRHHKKPANHAGAKKPYRPGRHPKIATSGATNTGGIKRSANQQPRPPRPRANPNTNKNSK